MKLLDTSLNDVTVKLRIHGRHPMLSYLSSLPIAVLRSLGTEANRFYDRNHQLYDAALLTRCYTQHALRPFIDFESNHIRSFIDIPFVNKGKRYKYAKITKRRNQEKIPTPKTELGKNQTNNQVLIP